MGIEKPQAAHDNEKPKEWGMSEAIGEVLRLEHLARQSEPVDSEPNAFATIRSQIINSSITPQQGVAKAEALLASMQSYH